MERRAREQPLSLILCSSLLSFAGLSAAVSLSSIIRETAQNYNNYFRLSAGNAERPFQDIENSPYRLF
jgi:hypothetical protein